MTILFDARRSVKSRRRFGAGLLAWSPSVRVPYTAADAAWWTTQSNQSDLDARAAEAEATDRLERGYCC